MKNDKQRDSELLGYYKPQLPKIFEKYFALFIDKVFSTAGPVDGSIDSLLFFSLGMNDIFSEKNGPVTFQHRPAVVV